jgi:hypothetical protein
MSDLVSIKWNNFTVTTDDLFRLQELEGSSLKTDNERFLCLMIDKLFLRIAELQDQVNDLKGTMLDSVLV